MLPETSESSRMDSDTDINDENINEYDTDNEEQDDVLDDDEDDDNDDDDDEDNDKDDGDIDNNDEEDDNIEESTGGNKNFIDTDLSHVSDAPLHLAQGSRKCIKRKRLKQLRKSFNINRGPWRSKELKRLKKNWKRITKHHPDFSDPRFAFGGGHNFERELTKQAVKEKMRAYRDFRIMLRMAYKLDKRLICDIYIRCRKMFYDKSFHFTRRQDLPSELDKRVRHDLKKRESVVALSSKYNISPSVLESIKRRPDKIRKRYTWCQESEQNLLRIIELTHGNGTEKQLLAREIDWKLVAKEMNGQNWIVDRDQCYNKYVKLVPHTVVRRYSKE